MGERQFAAGSRSGSSVPRGTRVVWRTGRRGTGASICGMLSEGLSSLGARSYNAYGLSPPLSDWPVSSPSRGVGTPRDKEGRFRAMRHTVSIPPPQRRAEMAAVSPYPASLESSWGFCWASDFPGFWGSRAPPAMSSPADDAMSSVNDQTSVLSPQAGRAPLPSPASQARWRPPSGPVAHR